MSNKGNVLRANEILRPGDYLVSSLGTFFAVMQHDGNFCIYRGNSPGTNQREFIWGIQKLEPAAFAIMQSDGNFCVYYGLEPGRPGNRLVFSIDRIAKIRIPINHRIPVNPQLQAPAITHLYAIMEDTGNFAVYMEIETPGTAKTKTLIWETGTRKDDLKPLTFAFMNDIHFSKDYPSYYQAAKEVLATLSKLANYKWPRESHDESEISIDAVFVNGDLTDYGGQHDTEKNVEALFIRDTFNPDATKFATYVGLGNHDEDPDGEWYEKDDAYRNRMWGTIGKFHASQILSFYPLLKHEALLPVTYIDAPDSLGNGIDYKWKSHSYNYVVEYASVAVFQLHRYGGDSYHDRAGGLSWFKNQLDRIGQTKPIIIHQHYGWDEFSTQEREGADKRTGWTEQEWAPLLRALEGHNVIGIFHGHIHYPIKYHYRYEGVAYDLFSPGSVRPDKDWAGHCFGICRVGLDGKIDVLFLNTGDLGNQEARLPIILRDRRQLFTTNGIS